MTHSNREDATDQEEAARDPYAAFRVASYRAYIGGWFIATMGTAVQTTAISWEVYQRTGEALSLGIIGAVLAVPTMLLALPAGYMADRYNRVRLMQISLCCMTVTSLALALLSYMNGPLPWMYAVLMLDAAAVMIGRPARSALMPQLVPPAVFPNAVTWNMSLGQISRVAGPALGGVVIIFSIPAAYAIAAASSVIFIVLLAGVRYETRTPEQREQASQSSASWKTVLGGLTYIRQNPIILSMISLDLFAVLLGGAVYLLPIYASDILQVGAAGFGWLRAAPAIGAFCMAISLVYLPPIRRAGWTLLTAVGGFGVATIVFGVSTSFWLSFAMLFLTGLFDNVSVVIRQTAGQLLTPDSMRGRVSAVSSVFIGASNELGGLESGLVAQWLGPVFSVVSGGVGTLLVVLSMGLLSPQLRAFDALHEAKPPEGAEEAGRLQSASKAS